MIFRSFITMAKVRRHINRTLRQHNIPIPETERTDEGTSKLMDFYIFMRQNDFNPLYAISYPDTPAELQEKAEEEGWS